MDADWPLLNKIGLGQANTLLITARAMLASAYNDEWSRERLVFSHPNNSDRRQLKATNQDWLGGLLDIVASMIGTGRCHWLTCTKRQRWKGCLLSKG